MKNLLTLLVALSIFPAYANARSYTDQEIHSLVKKIRAKRAKIRKGLRASSIPLVRFFSSPEQPVSGEEVTLFVQMDTSFTDQETVILGSLDGESLALEHPATELWVADLGSFSEVRAHSFRAQVFIQSAADAAAIREAITVLEGEIATLNDQIANETDPAIVDQLTALRDQKVAQKDLLIQALSDLKSPVGEEIFNFSVSENTASPDYPHIGSVSPNVVKLNTTKTVSIFGSNFGADPVVSVGGTALEVTATSPTSIQGNLPGIAMEGAKDIEVRFSDNGKIKNAYLKNAFFVTNEDFGGPGPDQRPVAVPFAVISTVQLGAPAAFQSAASYDPEGQPIRREWRLISKPVGSALVIPSDPPGTEQLFGVIPDVPGHYVAELRVFEEGGLQQESYPALAVVQVLPANEAPTASAPSIHTANGVVGTSQVVASDPNQGQSLTFSISVAPANGQATVSETGLVIYVPNAGFFGSDTLQVAVTDNGNPPLSALVDISVLVDENLAPVASAPSITVGVGITGTSQVSASDPNQGQTLSYSIGTAPANGTASVSATGLVEYIPNSGFSGSDSIEVVVADSGSPSLSTSVVISVEVLNNLPPVIPSPLFYTIRTKGVPIQVGLGLSGNPAGSIYDPDGTIASMEWDFGDGTKEKTFDTAFGFLLHNYVAPGTYTATLTVKDNLGGETSSQITVNVVDTDIPTAKFTADPSNGGGGVLPLTITFDASASGDVDGITQYRWRWGSGSDEITSSPTITHTFTNPGNYAIRLRTRDANFAQGESVVNINVGGTVSGAQSQAQFLIGPPREVLLGNSASFDASRSFNPNVGGTLAVYDWNFNDFFTCGGPTGGCTGSGISTNYTYPEATNYFPNLQVQTGGGGLSQRLFQEMFVVNAGHAPKAVPRADVLSGVAPLSVSFSGGESYDYDGTISSYDWFFGDNAEPVCNPECDNQGANVQHTFQDPGVYLVRLTIADNDGNMHFSSLTVNVAASRSELTKKAPRTEFDPEREYQRQILTNACSTGSGEACSYLADMYLEDGNQSMATQLKARACSLGYSAACTLKKND